MNAAAGAGASVAGQREGDVEARQARLERLSSVDAANLRVEAHGGPMHVAGLAVIDRTALLDAAGRLRLEEVRGPGTAPAPGTSPT